MKIKLTKKLNIIFGILGAFVAIILLIAIFNKEGNKSNVYSSQDNSAPLVADDQQTVHNPLIDENSSAMYADVVEDPSSSSDDKTKYDVTQDNKQGNAEGLSSLSDNPREQSNSTAPKPKKKKTAVVAQSKTPAISSHVDDYDAHLASTFSKSKDREKNKVEPSSPVVSSSTASTTNGKIVFAVIQEQEVKNGSLVQLRVIQSSFDRPRIGDVFYSTISFSDTRVLFRINRINGKEVTLKDINDEMEGLSVSEDDISSVAGQAKDDAVSTATSSIPVPYAGALINGISSLAKRKNIKIKIHKNQELFTLIQ